MNIIISKTYSQFKQSLDFSSISRLNVTMLAQIIALTQFIQKQQYNVPICLSSVIRKTITSCIPQRPSQRKATMSMRTSKIIIVWSYINQSHALINVMRRYQLLVHNRCLSSHLYTVATSCVHKMDQRIILIERTPNRNLASSL